MRNPLIQTKSVIPCNLTNIEARVSNGLQLSTNYVTPGELSSSRLEIENTARLIDFFTLVRV